MNKLKKIQELQKMLKETEEQELSSWEGKKIMGFTLRRSWTTDKGYKYRKFYAFKSKKIQGETVRANIYVGNDPEDAEEKIRKYCVKKGLKKLLDD